ncbi:PIG-L family deacetylase [Alphaproteobacteria bacterium]|nr:PIG-L family deacetylase [Alphaproteobacteria bacterium]
MSKRILVVAAHPDDEALGCGGTIAKHGAAGDEIYAVFMTDGVMARHGASSAEANDRWSAAISAASILGLSESFQLGFPDNRMDSVPLLDVVQALEKVIAKVRPEVIYTHHAGDLNIDHKVTHQAVLTACRPVPGSTVTDIFAFEVLSSTEWADPNQFAFCPTMYVDITPFVHLKQQALVAYASEMRAGSHSRSVKHVCGLGEHRGNSVGVAAAEAFEVIRIIK